MSLRIREVVNAPLEMQNTRVDLDITGGLLTADLGSSLAGMPLQGEVRFGAVEENLVLRAALRTEHSDVTRLTALASGDESFW